MLVLGVDPGTVRIGYGLVRSTGSQQLAAIAYGCIDVDRQLSAPQGLLTVATAMRDVLARYQPEAVAVEQLFFGKNARTALAVGQARGVILLVAAERGLPVYEYTPAELKSAVVGYARADKYQVQTMTCQLLRLAEIPRPPDAADALACAITCLLHVETTRRRARLGLSP